MTPSPYSPPSPRPSLSPSHFGSVGGGGWGVPDPQWEGGGRFGRGGGSSTATTRSWGRRSPTRYSRRSIYRSWSSWSTDRPLSTASWRRYSGRSIHGSALGKTAGSSWARYQEEKASSKFYLCTHCRRWKYTDWNRWRKQEGMLCRTSADCNWLNQDLRCSSYKRSFTPNRNWFNGDFASIHGLCECPMGMVWNDWELTCYVSISHHWKEYLSFSHHYQGIVGFNTVNIQCTIL